jgi:hypothetical protein
MKITIKGSVPRRDDVEKPRVIFPSDYVSDPIKRRRLARELKGGIPDIMTQQELRKLRNLS